MTSTDFAYDGPIVDAKNRPTLFTVCVYVAALIGADATARPFSIEVSLACDAGVLLVLLIHCALASSATLPLQRALASLALVPTLKLGAVVLPQRAVPDELWEILPAALALATVVALRRLAGIPSGRAASRRLNWRAQLPIAATGVPFAVAAAVALSALDITPREPGLTETPAGVLLGAAVSGLALEIVFRGVIQPCLIEVFGLLGILPTSLLYAGIFLDSGSTFIIVLALLTGVAWGILARATGSVSGVAVSHALFALSWTVLY